MESRLMNLVKAMHIKFGLEHTGVPTRLTPEESKFRITAMQEELNEYKDAVEEGADLVAQYDALLDLIVFAVGTLERQGFPLLAGFEAVMEANMAKELGQNGEKRGGFKRDLVKPVGWVGPESKLLQILNGTHAVRFERMISGDVTVAPASDGKLVEGYAPKFDANKVPVDLLPIEPLLQIAHVFGLGARKYFANSYRTGETVAWSRTYGSILRHLFAFWNGEDFDKELGTHHVANAGTQIMILLEHIKNNPDKDDRFKG